MDKCPPKWFLFDIKDSLSISITNVRFSTENCLTHFNTPFMGFSRAAGKQLFENHFGPNVSMS